MNSLLGYPATCAGPSLRTMRRSISHSDPTFDPETARAAR
ncbi:hypothetical protein MMEU_1836 [Mycobacterium marinum str. Europe]|nr:hypothetical protein MMEU_1836 [Mycobacterium marinum str. Europe]